MPSEIVLLAFRRAFRATDGEAMLDAINSHEVSLDDLKRACQILGLPTEGRAFTLRLRAAKHIKEVYIEEEEDEEEDDPPGAEEFETNADGISLKEAVELLHNFPDDKVIKALMNYPVIRDNVVGSIAERDQYLTLLKEACLALALEDVAMPPALEDFWAKHGSDLLAHRHAEIERLQAEIARGQEADLKLQKLLNVEVVPDGRPIRRITLRRRANDKD